MMIIVSKLADYAVVLAVQLGHMGQKIGSSAGLTQASTVDLAEMTKLPGATVAKVLKALHRAGIVLSARGAAGGYRLARDPEDLTVAEVIAAIDGPLGMTECAGEVGHEVCTHMSYCVARPHWARVTLVVQAALGAVTIEDMMAPPFAVAAPMSRNVSPLAQGAEAS